jgi:hypothetical protein
MEEQRIAFPDLAAEYEELATLYDKKYRAIF